MVFNAGVQDKARAPEEEGQAGVLRSCRCFRTLGQSFLHEFAPQ